MAWAISESAQPAAQTRGRANHVFHLHIEHDMSSTHRRNAPYHCVYEFDSRAVLRRLETEAAAEGLLYRPAMG